jgi:hypothetical protein
MIATQNDDTDLIKAAEVQSEHILLPVENVEHIEKLLELSIFIKDKKSANPISVLTVVSNNDEAEINILVKQEIN